ncbi:MAG: AmmeMemoRadiSam system protein B [Actinomycetota bacterium]
MVRVRPPAVAGAFYPGEETALRRVVRRLFAEAEAEADGRPAPAVVGPHAGYQYSGVVAARAHARLAHARRVILLGPSHYEPVTRPALAPFEAFATPLGEVKVDLEAVERLAHEPHFTVSAEAHLPEHSLEVHLPFLQERLPEAQIVPCLMGIGDPAPVVPALAGLISEGDTALLVSTDLSHYHPDAAARAMDSALLDSLLAGDLDAVRAGEACGRGALLALAGVAMLLGWKGKLIAYATSSQAGGSTSSVVGYAALAYATSGDAGFGTRPRGKAEKRERDSRPRSQPTGAARREGPALVSRPGHPSRERRKPQ